MLEEIKRLFIDEWLSLSEIGEKFGVSRQYIHQIIKSSGGSAELLAEERESLLIDKISPLSERGYSIGKIANELKHPYSRIQRIASKCPAISIRPKQYKQGDRKDF